MSRGERIADMAMKALAGDPVSIVGLVGIGALYAVKFLRNKK